MVTPEEKDKIAAFIREHKFDSSLFTGQITLADIIGREVKQDEVSEITELVSSVYLEPRKPAE